MIIALKVLSILGIFYMLVYTIWNILKNKKMLQSLSATAYIVKSPWVFTLSMSIAGFSIAPYMIALLPGWWGMVGMLFLSGLILVGCSPHYKTIYEDMHNFGGYLAGIMTQVAVGYIYWPFLLIWLPFLLWCIFGKSPNKTFYAEALCFITLGICLLIF